MIVHRNIKKFKVFFGEDLISIEIYSTDTNSNIAMLLIPPDPNWGGSMYTPLIDNLFYHFGEAGVSVCRFTFTKYQAFNNIVDKYVIQTSICLEELIKEIGKVKFLWIIGYSMGSLVALNMFLRRPEITGFIMIAPPLSHYDFLSWITICQSTGLLIYGTRDELLPETLLDAYIKCLKNKKIDIVTCPIFGVGHTFQGKFNQIITEIQNFIDIQNSKTITYNEDNVDIEDSDIELND